MSYFIYVLLNLVFRYLNAYFNCVHFEVVLILASNLNIVVYTHLHYSIHGDLVYDDLGNPSLHDGRKNQYPFHANNNIYELLVVG